jgi:hypothetical protein
LLLYVMIVVQISDVFQYVFGKLFGRTRLSPAISPSKTVEGLLGGGLTAVLIGAGLSGIAPFSPLQAAAMSAVIVVVVLWRLCPVGDQARSRRQGLGQNHRGPQRNPRPQGLEVVRLAAVLPPDALLFRDMTGGRRAADQRPRGRSQVLLCWARINSLFVRFNSLFGRLGNLLAAIWKTNGLPDRIASRNGAKAIFPGIFPSAREAPQLFGLKGAATQLVVGMAVAGHPAR